MINNYCLKQGNLIFAAGQIHSISPSVVANGTFFNISYGAPYPHQKMLGCIILESGATALTYFSISSAGSIGISYSGSVKITGLFFCGVYTISEYL